MLSARTVARVIEQMDQKCGITYTKGFGVCHSLGGGDLTISFYANEAPMWYLLPKIIKLSTPSCEFITFLSTFAV
ncbi:hypothetical protein TorRG33x02_260050 [Trema orientale]|uniref:Uncharacterized protein n=1 Tax=Trema orientale TaxID=63057 RepID=A0A2P5D7G7_TREOI|nr:hypothetical protein TorRG33x02_260050 [Trema orientale]